MVAQFLAHKPVNFASLTDSFKIIETLILDANNSSSGPKTYRDFRERNRKREAKDFEKVYQIAY